jgi:DNA-binding NarL/FixJ family response regulator
MFWNMIRVLIVEDDLFYLSFIEKKLMDFKKYEIVGVAESVIGAYNIIRAKAPDIIISDVKLKGNSSGFDLAKMIEDRNIPVLFMTESDDQKIYEQAADIVLSGILIKPFHIYSLDSSVVFVQATSSLNTAVTV